MVTLNDVRAKLDPVKTMQVVRKYLPELAPPTPTEIPKAIRDLRGLFKVDWRNMTVREAFLNTLVTTEVICWFFVGECIGKGTIIGYQV
jgi:F-type H+-transporting ATPase subunit g